MSSQFKVGVPTAKRVAGWLYDADSGECIGIASDQLKAVHAEGAVFRHVIAGCPHRAVIHGPIVINPGIAVNPGIEVPVAPITKESVSELVKT